MINTARTEESLIFSNHDDTKSSCQNKLLKERENRYLKKIYAKNQNIEDCLSTLDIFKSLMDDAEEMKTKIVRDVAKSIFISSYQEGQIIYDVQDQSNEIFLVFQGTVSLNIRKRVEVQEGTQITHSEEPRNQFIYEEVQTFEKGQGFGEAQFIRGRTRDFQACVKTKGSIIGRLHIESFEEVIENYKMRVYYKKLDMFKKCPLLSQISGNRLEFIVNSSKPLLLNMSKTLIKQGQYPKSLYLVSKGQLQFVKNNSRNETDLNEISSWKSKKVSRYFVKTSDSKQKLQIRKVNEGSFIGDAQIALNKPFDYDILASSQKVYLYVCDIRLILSQIPVEDLQKSKLFYMNKQNIQNHQVTEIKKTRKIASQNYKISSSFLSPQQIQIKKQIRKRYLNVSPFSLIDESSPQEISKMLERKRSRMQTQASQSHKTVPQLQLFQKNKSPPKRKRYLPQSGEFKLKRAQTMEYSSASISPVKIQKQRIKSYRDLANLNTIQKDTQVEGKRLVKRKISLPPIVSVSMIKKRSSQKRKSEVKPKKGFNLSLSQSTILDHRMNELINKIQQMRQFGK